MISFSHTGSFDNTERFLKRLKSKNFRPIIEAAGREGIEILRKETPKETGVSADSWGFRIAQTRNSIQLFWTNSHVTPGGTPIVILLQYGHGTRGGTYVQGRDFINPAMKPLFDKLSERLWKEVTRL